MSRTGLQPLRKGAVSSLIARHTPSMACDALLHGSGPVRLACALGLCRLVDYRLVGAGTEADGVTCVGDVEGTVVAAPGWVCIATLVTGTNSSSAFVPP